MLEPSQLHRSSKQSRPELVACPFGKLRPEKHTSCSSKTFRGMSRLKEHLFRRHRPKYYCQRCLRAFQTVTEQKEHFLEERVCRLILAAPDFLTHSQCAQLERKLLPASSRPLVEARWYQVWDICFPGQERPVSIGIENKDVLATSSASYHEFVSLEGPQILADVLSKSGYNGPGTRDALLKILQNGLDLIFSRWVTIREKRAKGDCEPPTIESSSSTSKWAGSTLAASTAPDPRSPSNLNSGERTRSIIAECRS